MTILIKLVQSIHELFGAVRDDYMYRDFLTE